MTQLNPKSMISNSALRPQLCHLTAPCRHHFHLRAVLYFGISRNALAPVSSKMLTFAAVNSAVPETRHVKFTPSDISAPFSTEWIMSSGLYPIRSLLW